MTKTKFYTKSQKKDVKKIARFMGLGLSVCGIGMVFYIFAPYVLYQLSFAKAFASQSLKTPIPQVLVVTNSNAQNQAFADTTNIDDELLNASNWFPTYNTTTAVQANQPAQARAALYYITIPKINITNAQVSTIDMNLAAHMVNYAGTAIPPEKGNAVTFGHSTLPSLYTPGNYKTILANAYKLAVGDEFFITVDGQQYTYDIYSITVVEPDDTSVFAQSYDDSYFTLITCTPPGTTFQRLVIKSRLRT
ncbi:MAG TPA: sortase [Candidatus Saccharimonadales bacterium]|nr:sortase [Candidatus Saccharimonadales bacterium]